MARFHFESTTVQSCIVVVGFYLVSRIWIPLRLVIVNRNDISLEKQI